MIKIRQIPTVKWAHEKSNKYNSGIGLGRTPLRKNMS